MSELSKTLSLLKPFARGLPLVGIIMASAIFLANRYLRYATPLYESTAKIKLADANEGPPSANLYKDFDVFANTNKILAEVELLKSNVLLNKALSRLDLNISIFRVGKLRKTDLYAQSPVRITAALTNPKLYNLPFSLTIQRDSLLTILVPGGKTVFCEVNKILSFDGGTLFIGRNDALLAQRPNLVINDRYEFIIQNSDSIVETVLKDLDVMAVDKDIPVLRISYKCPVAQKAADVVNAISAAYIADGVENRFRAADTTADFLNRELHDYQARLAASERAIESYRNNRNIINIRQETETDLRKIADLKKQLSSVHMNMLAIDSLDQYLHRNPDFLKTAPNFEAFNDLLSTEIVKKMKQLQGDRRELLVRYTVDHEKARLLDTQIDDLSDYLKESIKNTLSSLRIKHRDLQNTIKKAETEFIGLPTKEKTMTVLERNFSMDEQIFRFLHQKRTEADIARAATISFHRIITSGKVAHKPISPNPTLIKVLACFLSLLVSVILIYGIHFFKARVTSENQIYKNSETLVSASVPYSSKPELARRLYRQWTLQMELKHWLQPGSVLVVSSFDALEGKRTVTKGLAWALSELGKTILIIDADGMLQERELINDSEYVSLPEINVFWQRPEFWNRRLDEWRQAYDVILIKNASLSKESGALLLMATATLNLVLLDSRRTRLSRIHETDLLREKLDLPMTQFVLNRAGYNPSLFTELKRILLSLFKHQSTIHRPKAYPA